MIKYGLVFKYEGNLFCAEYLDDLGNIENDAQSITDEHNYYTDWNEMSIDLVKIETYQEDVMYQTSLCKIDLNCNIPGKTILDFIRATDFKEFAKDLFEEKINGC